jgi:hypothetical protein
VRLSRNCSLLLLLLLLCQCLVTVNIARHGRHSPAGLPAAIHQAFVSLRERIQASPLAVESPTDPEQERRDFVALWADLEPVHR